MGIIVRGSDMLRKARFKVHSAYAPPPINYPPYGSIVKSYDTYVTETEIFNYVYQPETQANIALVNYFTSPYETITTYEQEQAPPTAYAISTGSNANAIIIPNRTTFATDFAIQNFYDSPTYHSNVIITSGIIADETLYTSYELEIAPPPAYAISLTSNADTIITKTRQIIATDLTINTRPVAEYDFGNAVVHTAIITDETQILTANYAPTIYDFVVGNAGIIAPTRSLIVDSAEIGINNYTPIMEFDIGNAVIHTAVITDETQVVSYNTAMVVPEFIVSANAAIVNTTYSSKIVASSNTATIWNVIGIPGDLYDYGNATILSATLTDETTVQNTDVTINQAPDYTFIWPGYMVEGMYGGTILIS